MRVEVIDSVRVRRILRVVESRRAALPASEEEGNYDSSSRISCEETGRLVGGLRRVGVVRRDRRAKEEENQVGKSVCKSGGGTLT